MQMEYPLKDKIWTPKDTAFDSLKYNYFKKKKKSIKLGLSFFLLHFLQTPPEFLSHEKFTCYSSWMKINQHLRKDCRKYTRILLIGISHKGELIIINTQ